MVAECPHVQDTKIIHPQAMTSQGFPVDEDLKEFLEGCWKQGYETSCSCQGEIDVKHGFFGQRHNHPAFILFKTLEGAEFAFQSLLQIGHQEIILMTDTCHSEGMEFAVEFIPVKREN